LKPIRSAATRFLRRLKDDEVVRPASANRNTVKPLEERSLISAGKGPDPTHDSLAHTYQNQEITAALLVADCLSG
jgi:hypothetical protein